MTIIIWRNRAPSGFALQIRYSPNCNAVDTWWRMRYS